MKQSPGEDSPRFVSRELGGSRFGAVKCREKLLWCGLNSGGACCADVMPLTIDVRNNISQSVAIGWGGRGVSVAEKHF